MITTTTTQNASNRFLATRFSVKTKKIKNEIKHFTYTQKKTYKKKQNN